MSFGQNFLAKKLSTFAELAPAELEALARLQHSPVHLKPGAELVHQGEPGQSAYILQSGWGCSFKTLPDGARQIITIPIPGDFIGLRSALLRTSDHAFSAITAAQVCRVGVPVLTQLFQEFSHLGTAIMWAACRDEAVTVEHLASVGRRTSLERTAHFFLELHDRLQLVGLASSTEYECPLSQYVIADVLGLSAIHVNRVLRQLREQGLLKFQQHTVTLLDAAGLAKLAGYENVEAP